MAAGQGDLVCLFIDHLLNFSVLLLLTDYVVFVSMTGRLFDRNCLPIRQENSHKKGAPVAFVRRAASVDLWRIPRVKKRIIRVLVSIREGP